MVIFVSDFLFFLMMEIKVEAPSFPFPVRMLLPPSGGSSHDVTVSSPRFYASFVYMCVCLKLMCSCCIILLFNLHNWLHMLMFFFFATCFFSLIFLSCIHFNCCIYLLICLNVSQCIYPSSLPWTFRIFSNLHY